MDVRFAKLLALFLKLNVSEKGFLQNIMLHLHGQIFNEKK